MKTQIPWRTTLHLHSTSLETNTREERTTSWYLHLGGPSPPLFIGVAHLLSAGKIAWASCNQPWEELWRHHVEGEMWWSSTWFGRTMGTADLRLTPSGLIFGWATAWWALTPLVDDGAEVMSVCLGCGPSNPCDLRVVIRDWLRLFSFDQRVCFLLYFQLNSCIHKFLQGHVECRCFY
jgi:hypothetical protein